MARSLPIVVLLAALVTGCASEGDPTPAGVATIPATELRSLVLQPSDLPPGFFRFDEGELSVPDMPVGPRGDPQRFGRQGGWKARYRQPPSASPSGLQVVSSTVDLFATPEGTKRELAAYGQELEAERKAGSRRWEPLESPRLGDEALASTRLQRGGQKPIRYYTIAWRIRNVTAEVVVQGFDGEVSLDDALALARKQQEHIVAAAEAPASPAPS